MQQLFLAFYCVLYSSSSYAQRPTFPMMFPNVHFPGNLNKDCLTNYGSPGTCIPEALCPYLDMPRTICHTQFFVTFYCCSSGHPQEDPASSPPQISNGPFIVNPPVSPNLPPTSDLALYSNCLTESGLTGQCVPEIFCPYFRSQVGRITPRTVCNHRYVITFFCCPSGTSTKVDQVIKHPVNPPPQVPSTASTHGTDSSLNPRSPINEHSDCLMNDGQPGHCMAEFDCLHFRSDTSQSVQKIECNDNLFSVPFYCCPIVNPRLGSDPLSVLQVPQCVVVPTKRSLATGSVLDEEITTERDGIIFQAVGGIAAEKNSWPWMAAILTKTNDEPIFLCGATIINDRYILSAAHCFKSTTKNTSVAPEDCVVRLAEHNLYDSDNGEEYEVEAIINHEGYLPPVQYNDIALIRLKKRIVYSDKVQPICLPLGPEMSQDLQDELTTIIGWGVTQFGGRNSEVLNQVEIPVASNEFCNNSYSSIRAFSEYPNGIIDSQLCAGFQTGGKDACQGDSGGPLMIQVNPREWIIIGVVSGGYQCARPNFPGVYTRVSHYLHWLAQNIF